MDNRNRTNTSFLTTLNFLIYALLLCNISTTAIKWNYDKGGKNWQESCLTSDQGPIDIIAPFEYKRI